MSLPTLGADAQAIDLRAPLRALTGVSQRMASRFATLAMLGAAGCAPIPPEARLYLASGLGDIVATDLLYAQVVPPRAEAASPATFVGSPNNMAAFFVAKLLGLRSRNLTICDDVLSFEAALATARADLASGAVAHALVGAVDECTHPRPMYLQRFDLDDSEPIGEGCGWLHLSDERAQALGELLTVSVLAPGALLEWPWEAPCVLRGFDPPAHLPMARKTIDYQRCTGRYPTACAPIIAACVSERHAGTYLHVSRDARGRTGVIGFRVFG